MRDTCRHINYPLGWRQIPCAMCSPTHRVCLTMNAIVEGGHAMSNEKNVTSFHVAIRQLSATATSLKIKVGSVREMDPRGEKKRPKGAREPWRQRRVDHTPLRLTPSRREEGYLWRCLSRAHFSPSRSIFSIVLCPPMRVLETSLSLPSFSPLLCTFASFSVSFLPLLLPSPSFVSSFSILRRICPACFSVTLRHPPRRVVWLSSSLFSFSLLSSACLPSSSRTGRSCRARGWLASSWPTG